MGSALARAAQQAGHNVTLISASDLQPPVGVYFVGVDSAAEMFDAVKKYFPRCDCLIMAAAVADYTPVKKSKIKIKKSKRDLVIRLRPTVDILAWAGKHKHERRATSNGPRFVVGFALEDKNLRQNAEKKIQEKNLDMIIANTPAAIGSDKSTVQIKTPNGKWLKLTNKTKTAIAGKIIDLLTC
jgi:phosphopantothenoylcysteine decarboxylase/phosphopantothenate--cysteine ligase